MKRNHFVRDSQATIFKNSTVKHGKPKHILSLSLFATASIFITSIVLATSQPTLNANQTQVIDLPNLPAAMQSVSEPTSQATTHSLPELKANTDSQNVASKESVDQSATHVDNVSANPSASELAILEQQALDESLSQQAVNEISSGQDEVPEKKY
jgi:hypothetical protein